jgi:hypothetical protein
MEEGRGEEAVKLCFVRSLWHELYTLLRFLYRFVFYDREIYFYIHMSFVYMRELRASREM